MHWTKRRNLLDQKFIVQTGKYTKMCSRQIHCGWIIWYWMESNYKTLEQSAFKEYWESHKIQPGLQKLLCYKPLPDTICTWVLATGTKLLLLVCFTHQTNTVAPGQFAACPTITLVLNILKSLLFAFLNAKYSLLALLMQAKLKKRCSRWWTTTT